VGCMDHIHPFKIRFGRCPLNRDLILENSDVVIATNNYISIQFLNLQFKKRQFIFSDCHKNFLLFGSFFNKDRDGKHARR